MFLGVFFVLPVTVFHQISYSLLHMLATICSSVMKKMDTTNFKESHQNYTKHEILLLNSSANIAKDLLVDRQMRELFCYGR